MYNTAFAAIAAGAVIVVVCIVVSGGYKKSAMPAASLVPQEQQPLEIIEPPHVRYTYIEVLEGCGPYFEGPCVNLRSGPGEEYPVVAKLRIGVVLRVGDTVTGGGRTWHRIRLDDGVRYPERVTAEWFVAAEFVREFYDEGVLTFTGATSTPGIKRIIVDRSEQMLYAYDGDTLFMQERISTGLEFTPTPRGIFTVYQKTPSRYMQGPLPGISDQYFDLPGVPWNLYFTPEGGVIHGAYWHDNFGQQWSHGCVNLEPQRAKELYAWADVGTIITVRD